MTAKKTRLQKELSAGLRAVQRAVPSEAFEQLRLVAWLQSKKLRFTHVVGNASSKRAGAKNKRMGMSPGFPDLIILVPGEILFVELKRRERGRVSAEQQEWIEALEACGGRAQVCRGFEEAKRLVESYL